MAGTVCEPSVSSTAKKLTRRWYNVTNPSPQSFITKPAICISENVKRALQLRSLLNISNLQLRRILLQDTFIVVLQACKTKSAPHVHLTCAPQETCRLLKTNRTKGSRERKWTYLPKLLRSILSCNALQNLCSSGVLIDEVCDVVDSAVHDDVETLVG